MFLWRPRLVTARIIITSLPTVVSVPPYDYLLAEGRRKGLLAVGYHFVIDTEGYIASGRELYAVGSHTPGHNHDSIGVCLGLPFSEAQREALAGLVYRLECLYGHLEIVGRAELPRQRGFTSTLPIADLRQYIRQENSQLPTPSTPDLSTQQQLILNYLRAGHTLSTQIAMVSLGIASLSSRIAELRALGFNIQSEEARDYHGRRYLKYTLRDQDTIIADEAPPPSPDTARWFDEELRAGRVVSRVRTSGDNA